jgi:hypothetical protein
MSLRKRRLAVLSILAGSILVLFNVSSALAVPSFARQTGLACSACHTTPPQLNAAGRRFKLTGYTDRDTETPAVTSKPATKHAPLDLLKTLPLSAWLETSLTTTKSAVPGTQNGTFQLPQDISLFLAGAWTDHVGSFLQITYDPQDDHFTMDNTDVRIAKAIVTNGHDDLIYGLTLNNNPTVEDLWHTTPAWGFPFIASPVAPAPSAAPIIASLGQDVAGVGGYGMWNEHLYGDVTVYRSNHLGAAQPNAGTDHGINIQGVAPYWRLAWQQAVGTDTYLEVGTYGIQVRSTPNSITGPRDRFTDNAIDAQLDQTLFIRDVLSLRASYTRERSSLEGTLAANGADQASHNLRMINANAEYHFGNVYSAALGVNKVTGTSDATLFAPAAITGSANGSPSSTTYIANLSWWPVQNFLLAGQYSWYPKFNGGSTNYDASGRNANQNNALYLLARFVF